MRLADLAIGIVVGATATYLYTTQFQARIFARVGHVHYRRGGCEAALLRAHLPMDSLLSEASKGVCSIQSFGHWQHREERHRISHPAIEVVAANGEEKGVFRSQPQAAKYSRPQSHQGDPRLV